jgi:hypothetical protein
MARAINIGRTVNADGNGTETAIVGGFYTFHGGGTYDGAQIKLQYKPTAAQGNHTQQFADTDVIIDSTVSTLNFSVGPGSVRYVSSSTGSSTDLDLTLTKVS